MHRLRDHFKSLAGDRALVWVLFAVVLLIVPLLFTSSLSRTLLSQMGIAIIVCLSYNILLGQGGMLSFGHAVYSGTGSFLAIHTLILVSGGLPLPVSLIPLLGGLASTALAVLLGWVSTQKAATPFAMITLGIGEMVWAVSLMFPEFFGGEAGVAGNRVAGSSVWGISYGPQIELYYLIAAYTFVCTGLMFAFTRTPLGRMLNAVRDNPERAEFIGYDARKVRHFAFVVAAFFAGISGGLAALNFEIVTSEVLSGQRSGAYLLFTFLGGSTFFIGPIIGAILMVLVVGMFSGFTKAWLLYLGLVFMLVVVHAPGGVASLIMTNLRVAAFGHWRRLWASYLALALSAALILMGGGAMIEMAYHLQLDAALGSELTFLGWELDSTGPGSWLACALMLLAGLGWFAACRGRFIKQWARIQESIEQQIRRGDAP